MSIISLDMTDGSGRVLRLPLALVAGISAETPQEPDIPDKPDKPDMPDNPNIPITGDDPTTPSPLPVEEPPAEVCQYYTDGLVINYYRFGFRPLDLTINGRAYIGVTLANYVDINDPDVTFIRQDEVLIIKGKLEIPQPVTVISNQVLMQNVYDINHDYSYLLSETSMEFKNICIAKAVDYLPEAPKALTAKDIFFVRAEGNYPTKWGYLFNSYQWEAVFKPTENSYLPSDPKDYRFAHFYKPWERYSLSTLLLRYYDYINSQSARYLAEFEGIASHGGFPIAPQNRQFKGFGIKIGNNADEILYTNIINTPETFKYEDEGIQRTDFWDRFSIIDPALDMDFLQICDEKTKQYNSYLASQYAGNSEYVLGAAVSKPADNTTLSSADYYLSYELCRVYIVMVFTTTDTVTSELMTMNKPDVTFGIGTAEYFYGDQVSKTDTDNLQTAFPLFFE